MERYVERVTSTLTPEEIAVLEAEAQEPQRKNGVVCETSFSSNFLLIPDDGDKTISIMPGIPGAVLKVNAAKAAVLAEAIQNQIQKWL
jgi:hypothetical protein